MWLPKELFLSRLIYLTGDEVDIRLNFPYFIDIIVDYALTFIEPYCFDLAFGIFPEIEVGKLQSLFLAFGGQQKFRVFIHDARNATIYIRNPLGNGFSIFLLKIFNIKVCQMWVFIFGSHPADHFGLLEVYNFSSTVVAIDCGAPLFVGLKINQPYFLIGTV